MTLFPKLLSTPWNEVPFGLPVVEIVGPGRIAQFGALRQQLLAELGSKGTPGDVAYYLFIERLAVLKARLGDKAEISIADPRPITPLAILVDLYRVEGVVVRGYPNGAYISNYPCPSIGGDYPILKLMVHPSVGQASTPRRTDPFMGGTDIRIYRRKRPAGDQVFEMYNFHENLELYGSDAELSELFVPLFEDLPIPVIVTGGTPPSPLRIAHRNALHRSTFEN